MASHVVRSESDLIAWGKELRIDEKKDFFGVRAKLSDLHRQLSG